MRPRLVRATALGLVVLGLASSAAPPTSAQEDWLGRKKKAAIARGSDWLKRQQQKDGSWDYAEKPFALDFGGGIVHMRQGTTALAALALLKAGMSPSDSCITKAFDFMRSAPTTYTYAAGCVLLAIEAKYNDDGDDDEPAPGGTAEKRGSRHNKPGGKDLDLAKQCLEFIKVNQLQGGWHYPAGSNEDASNTQYALLGLDAAERMGLAVPKEAYEKASAWFVARQQPDGPEVASFPVLGADCTYKELKAIEHDLTEKIRKIDADFKGKKKGALNAVGHTEDDEKRAAEEGAARTVSRPASSPKMFARGWSYSATTETQTGAMTASGLACLFICKSHLEGQSKYESSLKAPIDKALRDGAGWLARNFAVSENPGQSLHHLYYLYGLERAGILGLIPVFGEHDWFTEGAKFLIDAQREDASWDARGQGTCGPVVDTAFALLFLARGTTPIVRLPQRTATGPGSETPPAPQGTPPPGPPPPPPTPDDPPRPAPSPTPPPEGGE